MKTFRAFFIAFLILGHCFVVKMAFKVGYFVGRGDMMCLVNNKYDHKVCKPMYNWKDL